MTPATRCPWAIKYGATLTTRCDLPEGHHESTHEGPGYVAYPYQRVSWLAGDRREFLTERDESASWEEAPCPVPSSITGVACLLPAGHPQDSETRFHRYPRPGGLE